ILTFSNNIQGSEDRTVDKVHSIIRKYVEDGTIPMARIDESYHRIMNLKQKLGSSQASYYRMEWLKAQQGLGQYKSQLRQTESELELLKDKVDGMPEGKPKKKKKKN
nr:hypothetical protein [Cyclobacteriaceae bacterium]